MPGRVEDLTASFNAMGASFNTSTRMHSLDIDIYWSEPTYPNGVIDHYTVSVYETGNSSAVVYRSDSVLVSGVTEPVHVLPYTNYTVRVFASTSAGEGPHSTIVIESPEAGTYFSFHQCMLP